AGRALGPAPWRGARGAAAGARDPLRPPPPPTFFELPRNPRWRHPVGRAAGLARPAPGRSGQPRRTRPDHHRATELRAAPLGRPDARHPLRDRQRLVRARALHRLAPADDPRNVRGARVILPELARGGGPPEGLCRARAPTRPLQENRDSPSFRRAFGKEGLSLFLEGRISGSPPLALRPVPMRPCRPRR